MPCHKCSWCRNALADSAEPCKPSHPSPAQCTHLQHVQAAHARLAPAARHHRGVRGHAAARGQDALRWGVAARRAGVVSRRTDANPKQAVRTAAEHYHGVHTSAAAHCCKLPGSCCNPTPLRLLTSAACMPPTSSGEVSTRSRMTWKGGWVGRGQVGMVGRGRRGRPVKHWTPHSLPLPASAKVLHARITWKHPSTSTHLLALGVPLLRLVSGEDDAAHGGAGGGGQALAQHRALVLRLAGACTGGILVVLNLR